MLKKWLKKKKNVLKIEDWIKALTSWGIPAELITEISGLDPPPNLHSVIQDLQFKQQKKCEQVLYNTSHVVETKHLFHNHKGEDYDHFNCKSKIVEVFENVEKKNIPNLVVLDESTFYPTSGG